ASASSSGEPATTPDSSRLTRANFDQIHKGMTEDQVKALLGVPTDVTFKTDPMEGKARLLKTLQWTQLNPPVTIEIETIDGVVDTKTTNLPPAPPPKKKKDETQYTGWVGVMREKFDSIENGMTQGEVTYILGPALGSATRTGTINGHEYHIRTLSWKH